MRLRVRLLVVLATLAALLAVPAPPCSAESTDDSLPALERFKDWPEREDRERAYWLPWGRSAFRRASLFSRPVFFLLTVNWSRAAQNMDDRVMVDPGVLLALNAGFVSVRANADVRPDLKERYQTGVWPVATFLLPDGTPMLARAQERDLSLAKPITTSAVDPETMEFLVREGNVFWSRQPRALIEMGEAWREREAHALPRPGRVGERASETLERWMLGNADRRDGGFGIVPKFFPPWLEEYASLLEARGRDKLRAHSRGTLSAFAAGALHDRRDGGIHRLAAAPRFGAISYEKLLTTNVAFLRSLTTALTTADDPDLRAALEGTARLLDGVLAAEGGGYHLAQAADRSSDDGGGYWRGDEGAAPPPVDPLVLSGPTLMAGTAMLRAGLAFEHDEWVASGRAAIERVLREGYRPGRGTRHVLAPIPSDELYLVTQADAVLGFADAFSLTGDERYLEAARDSATTALRNLKHPGETAVRDRLASPSDVGLLGSPRWPIRANVRLARGMLRVGWLTDDEELRARATEILGTFAADLSVLEGLGGEAGVALEEAMREPVRVVPPAGDDAGWRAAVARLAEPWVLALASDDSGRKATVAADGKKSSAKAPEELARAVSRVRR